MAAKKFTDLQWEKIRDKAKRAPDFGAPVRRDGSLVIGTFNICKLGKLESRSEQAWDFLASTCRRFDLLAVQEVQDDMAGLREIRRRLGKKYGLVVSDTTGKTPGGKGMAERLAFLFRWDRVERTELASDISYDRTAVSNALFEGRVKMYGSWDEHLLKIQRWMVKEQAAKAANKKTPSRPPIALPFFVTFIRQPLCASFRIRPLGSSDAEPFEFLVVNAHLLYGEDADERRWEFLALFDWLAIRAKQKDRTYHDNILLLGDCNFEYDEEISSREDLDARLKAMNKQVLTTKTSSKVNFPLLTPHPDHGLMTTNARGTETYDQIGIFAHDTRLPDYKENDTAGQGDKDAYDYGVYRFTDVVSAALHDGKRFAELTEEQQKVIHGKVKNEISDHLPAWIRLPFPKKP